MVRTYQDVFNELYILDVRARGNKILLAVPRDDRITRKDLARRAKTLSMEEDFPFDMGELVMYGFRRAGRENLYGRILLDKDRRTN
jgi:hypothetical protein